MNFHLVFLFVVASAVAEVVDINDEVDRYIEDWNRQIRNGKDAIYGLEADKIGDNIRYSDGYLYGLDSLQRTGDCTSSRRDNSTTYDCRFGLRLLLLAFPRVEIDGEAMSLYVRVRNNSFHLAYTEVESSGGSRYDVHAYEVEDFQDVELGASDPAYDGRDVEEFFVRTMKPIVDAMAKETLDPEASSEEDPEDDASMASYISPVFMSKHFVNFQKRFR